MIENLKKKPAKTDRCTNVPLSLFREKDLLNSTNY